LGCSHSQKSNTLKPQQKTQVKEHVEKRFLYEFYVDVFEKLEEYELTKKTTDSTIVYYYKSLTDNEKDMEFQFILKTKQLYFYETEFQVIKKDYYANKNLSKFNFDLYTLKEPVHDGNGPLFFNPNYGILNLNNGWGTHILYLKNESETKFATTLIKILEEKMLYKNLYN